MIDSDTELVELSPSEDSESEEENEGKEKKIKIDFIIFPLIQL